jgi:hypothetical protein
MNLNEHYRVFLHRRADCGRYHCGEDIPLDAACAQLWRKKASHRGIGMRMRLRDLAAHGANQEFLEEIASLTRLEYLELEWPVTATDLTPLTTLNELRILKINSPRNITDFSPLLELPKLERLFIENAKHMNNLDWLRPLERRLKVFGIEGSMYTAQRIDSLAPLEGFALEALFLTNTSIGDRSLAPLRTMDSLRYLSTARNAPRAEFEALHTAQPQLECDWFEPEMWALVADRRPPKA